MSKLFSESKVLSFLLTVFSAILFVKSISYFGLAWIAFIPVFFALKSVSLKYAVFLGFVFGVFFSIFTFYGMISYAFHVYLLVIFYFSLFTSIFSLCFSHIEKNLDFYWLKIFAIPAIWTFLEFVKSLGYWSFPTNLGLTQSKFIPLIQISSVTGIYGVSFLIILVNSALFSFIHDKHLRKILVSYNPLILLIFVVTLVVIIIYRGSRMEPKVSNGLPISVSVIQGSIPTWLYEIEKWEERYDNIIKLTYFRLTEQAIRSKTNLVVWPETAIHRWIMDVPLARNRLFELAREGNCFLLIGAPSLNGDKELNSVFVISPEGEIVGKYDKQQLVPLEEECFTPGKEGNVIKAGKAVLGINICFESIYPSISRRFVQSGANLLVICTNDGGFKKTLLVDLHAAYAAFRAVENRTYVIRAAQSGISLIVDPFGRVINESKIFEQVILRGSIDIRKTETFYSKYGDVFSYLCLVVFLMALILSFKERPVANV